MIAENVTYFDSFGVGHITTPPPPPPLKKKKNFKGNKNIITNIYIIQSHTI